MKPKNDSSFFLFGPRGTGKTSWLKFHYKDAIYIDLLKSQIYNDLRVRPERLWDLIPRNYRGAVIIDEIQKLPPLLDEIHSFMNEQRQRLQFILTGSSARKLKRAGVNLLAGRVRVQNFYPLIAPEVVADFNLKKALQFGMLPEAWTCSDPKEYLESYLRVYLDQEVRLEGLVRNVDDFARFLEAASLSQASVLNVSNVATDAGVPRKTVQTYFEILEDLLIAYRLPVFQKKSKRELIKHDKFFFFDCGLFQTIRPRGILDSDSEVNGAGLETLVFSHLIASNDLLKLGYELSYWHTKNHIEVDFVLYGQRGLTAIEVKSASSLREADLEGLLEFHKDYPKAKIIFLYGGATQKRGDVHAVNVADFLVRPEDYI
ncbi:MAG: ATP-binding protein [Bdellovibrionaceae bacterium]|nr:ATP-binding protein [Pseudobdellovibrionaceae bacterium]